MKRGSMNMYKKISLLSVALCLLTPYASNSTPLLEIKPSYFFFSASPMKNIYNDGGFEVQGSIAAPLSNHLDLYGSIGYRKAWGHALNSDEKTSLSVVPVDIGLKLLFNCCNRFYSFVASGPRYFHFHQHNPSLYVDPTINSGGVGFFINTGFSVRVTDCLMLGIFGEYSYEKQKIFPNSPNVYSNGGVQLGGFAFGLILGYAF